MKYGRERDTVSQSPRARGCFGDVTSLAPGKEDGCSIQTILPHVPAQSFACWVGSRCDCDSLACCAAITRSSPTRVAHRSGICLDLSGSVHLRIPTSAQCQASVAERQSSSRLKRGEAVMAHAARSRPAKRRTNRKAAGEALFNPRNF
jgi:hypothetical protein